jgi:tetratricopeptide (TPR) repeat protein
MHLHDSIALKDFSTVEPDVIASRAEVVLSRCLEALRREEVGDYDSARTILAEFWPGVGERPNIDGLEETATAELLLRSGTLSGKIGQTQQIKGAQEIAKDLISQSLRLYEALALTEKINEAQLELAACYFREGSIDEARVTLQDALERNPNTESEQRLKCLVTLGICESTTSRYQEALRIYAQAAPSLARSSNHMLRGAFHNQCALAYKNLGQRENRLEFIDKAFIEYTAASYHFEQAGHNRFLALVENNLGYLFLTANRPLEAHQHLNRARALFVKLRDKGSIAQVDETRARAFLSQGLFAQAENTVRTSVRTLDEGDERSLLSEALITHGTALARLERFERAYAQLKRAIDVAGQAGVSEKAGLAALTIIETLSTYVPAAGLLEYYRNAEEQLARSQSPDSAERLGRCARTILSLEDARVAGTSTAIAEVSTTLEDADDEQVQKPGSRGPLPGRSLEEEVLRYEGELIQHALEKVGGSVTRAARMLGITHQGLAFILNGRHRSLLTVRTPVRRRRKSIFRAQ